MSRWFWIVLAVTISTGVYFTIRYGLRPKPIPVLRPTEFQQLRQIGIVVYKLLHQNVRAERIVLLGSSEQLKDYDQVWSGLVESALADKEKLVIFVREGMKAPAPQADVEVAFYKEAEAQSGDLFREAAARLARKQLVVIYGWTHEITHLVKDSISQRLDPVVGHPVLAISTLPFAIQQAGVNSLQPQCLDPSLGQELRKLNCAAYKVARHFLKKRLAPDRIWAAAEQHGLKEFLIFIHQP